MELGRGIVFGESNVVYIRYKKDRRLQKWKKKYGWKPGQMQGWVADDIMTVRLKMDTRFKQVDSDQ